MDNTSHPGGYEKSDADPRLIAALALGTAGFLIVVPFLLAAGFPGTAQKKTIAGAPLPAPPRLQIDPKADLDRLHAEETAQLKGFAWVDRSRQIARIPIDRAMQLVTERGLPGWPGPARPAAASPR